MMDASRAYGAISDGHAGYSVDFGKEVARWFGVSDDVPTFTHSGKARHHKDWMGPRGTFVSGLDLAYHVANGLGLTYKDYGEFFGRGTQARAITAAIRKVRED